MRERPILFSAPMVLALLAGIKTQTRRVVKPQPVAAVKRFSGLNEIQGVQQGYTDGERIFSCPYGQPGDRLWVRETFKYAEHWHGSHCCTGGLVGYKADGAWLNCGGPFLVAPNLPEPKWRPSIFMPRALSRITLEVTEVRVQRVQEISEEDAKAEGVDAAPQRARDWYRDLWDSINAKRGFGWDENPWCWAITFRRVG